MLMNETRTDSDFEHHQTGEIERISPLRWEEWLPLQEPANYRNFAYSVSASFKMGTSRSAFFQSEKKV
jgi:hypothetical protein